MTLQGVNHGPTLNINGTSAIVAGTTSGYEESACFGPVYCYEDTVFNSNCVMHGGSRFAPDFTDTYPAGTWVFKYFTTLQLTSGAVEVCELKSLPVLQG